MTNKSYHSNYVKIYFWQGAAFILRFLSMFIVTPYLTKEPSTYGIYAVCLSVTIFLNYADLGFLRAGQKYAAEYYAKGVQIEEMKYIGFGTFILLIFASLCAILFLYFGYNPQALIKGLDSAQKISTASELLIILAIFTPVTVLQRMVYMIFDIRLDSYINQRISLFASIITIISVLYFFRNDHYQIVLYFLFSQSINFIAVLICLFLAKHKYNYNIGQLFRYVHFDPVVYQRVKSLAFSGLYVMILWIAFYELDQVVIGKFLGADKVAIYAIAFAFASFFRSIYGILFSPFTVRANYFVGNKDDEGLKRFCFQLLTLSAPLVLLPTIAFAIVAKPFIMSWVGANYNESVDLARFFSLIFTLSFISYSATMILTAKVRLKEMYIISTIQPIIYWIGILSTYSILGLLSFGSFKLIATVVSEVFYFYILVKFLNLSWKELYHRILYPIILPLVFLITSLAFADRYLPYEKSKINLFIVIGTTGLCILTSFLIQYMTSSYIRTVAKNLIGTVLNHKQQL